MKNQKDILAIIIPFRNRSPFLKETLHAVSLQQSPGIIVSLFLIDNGSTDNSKEIVLTWMSQNCPNWINSTLLEEPAEGVCRARNKGIEASTSEWIMFFDSDDYMPITHIKDIVKAINENGEKDLLYWDILLNQNQKNTLKKQQLLDLRIDVVIHSIWSTQRFVVKREYLDSVGRWNENLIVWNDWELGIRLLLDNPKIKHIDLQKSVIIFRHPDSLTGSRFIDKVGEWEKSIDAAYQNCIKRSRSDIQQLIDFKRLSLAAIYHSEGDVTHSNILINKTIRYSSISKWKIMFAFNWQRYIRRGLSYFIHYCTKF